MAGERLHRATACRPLPGNELDEPGHERQSLLVVRGTRGIARLPEARQVADHRDRPDAVVAALQSPRRDRRVVDRTVEREVELDVPLQTIDGRIFSAHAQIWRELIRYGIRDDIPVARWRLGARAVGPELDHRPKEVSLPHAVRRVWLSRDGIQSATAPVIRPEIVCPDRARRDVHRCVVRRVEEAAVAEHLDRLSPIRRVGGRVAEAGLWPGIHGSTGRATGGNGERRHVTPVRTDRLLDPVRQRDPVLAQHVLDLERLPAIRVDERNTGFADDERRVHRCIARVGVAVRLVRAVRLAVVENTFRDPVPDRRGSGALCPRTRYR